MDSSMGSLENLVESEAERVIQEVFRNAEDYSKCETERLANIVRRIKSGQDMSEMDRKVLYILKLWNKTEDNHD